MHRTARYTSWKQPRGKRPRTHRNVSLHEVVLGEIADALLGDDDVGVERHDLRTDVLDVFLLHP